MLMATGGRRSSKLLRFHAAIDLRLEVARANCGPAAIHGRRQEDGRRAAANCAARRPRDGERAPPLPIHPFATTTPLRRRSKEEGARCRFPKNRMPGLCAVRRRAVGTIDRHRILGSPRCERSRWSGRSHRRAIFRVEALQ